ncbi:ThuA domain-containing protein [Microbacterium sp. NPDC019599]|uniref:ThuA domain-containing protein n=1 Tax=Microbacterium sp. NPDC019599 TaxID=3154690 RepID=UPI0033E0F6E2
MVAQKKALVVRGGWDGHHPVEATERFIPFLREQGFDVRIEESTAVYADGAAMAETDLIVQCVTMSEIAQEELTGLRSAIEAGTGLTGWHGGIADSFRSSSDYLQLVGGIFATHPAVGPGETRLEGEENYREHTVNITELGRQHPITAGIGDFDLRTEQYWVLSDDLNDVLATTTHPAESWQQWHRPTTSPAVWTRRWGAGRIVVSTAGHSLDVLDDPNVRTIIERGMLWAARTASAS